MTLISSRTFALALTLVASACGAAAGTQPHDMSAADHQAAAAQEEEQAAGHAAQHDPNAQETIAPCEGGNGRVCWTDTVNPTEEHKKDAEQHHHLASQHRAASQALVDAEKSACAGISDEDRDISPFSRTADIVSVSPLHDNVAAGKSTQTRESGASIVFRATPGLTAEWLQRIVDCHAARNAAVGHDMPEMTNCPLVPKGAKPTVRSTGNGFAVDVRSDNAEGAAEIWRRAQALKPAG